MLELKQLIAIFLCLFNVILVLVILLDDLLCVLSCLGCLEQRLRLVQLVKCAPWRETRLGDWDLVNSAAIAVPILFPAFRCGLGNGRDSFELPLSLFLPFARRDTLMLSRIN